MWRSSNLDYSLRGQRKNWQPVHSRSLRLGRYLYGTSVPVMWPVSCLTPQQHHYVTSFPQATILCPGKMNSEGFWNVLPISHSNVLTITAIPAPTSSVCLAGWCDPWSVPEPHWFSLLPRIKSSSSWYVEAPALFL